MADSSEEKEARVVVALVGLAMSIGLTYFLAITILIPGFRELNGIPLGGSLKVSTVGIFLLQLVWYPLVVVNSCLLVSINRPLKPFRERGLVWYLVEVPFKGLKWGLVWGLVVGLELGFFKGLVAGLILGLVLGLLVGLVAGLVNEQKQGPTHN